jgi:acetyl-CoA synthetase
VIFGGFSPDSIVDRVNDSECVAIITADYGWRRGKKVPLKANVDEAIAKSMPSLKHVVVAKRVGDAVDMVDGRDVWWDDVVRDQPSTCEPERMNAEDLLYLLYTSGTTAKPKGIKHTTGGYLTGVTATHKLVFDLKEETDVYWCAADIGWVTGHSYIVYGPLCNGATSVIYEGTPDFPDKDRLWEIIERYKVTILYTAPTAIRTFMKWGTQYVEKHDLSSLRLLGSVGEPINPEAWIWYQEHIGGGRCPVVDTWWQTETGAIMISPLPGITTLKPGSATKPFPGVYADIVNDKGESVPLGGGGYIVLTKPWPSMLRGIYGDDDRYVQTYWSKFAHRYLAGDGCKRDEEGDYWFMGRIDDVMNVSGHRISTTEVESALVDHPDVAEAAVTGKLDDITGQAICAFVTLKSHANGSPELADELREHVAEKLGKFCRPKYLTFTQELPKTRSGKIMRRLLRDIAEGRMLGDTTTLADSTVVQELQQRAHVEASKED